jgi:hypothetical protein
VQGRKQISFGQRRPQVAAASRRGKTSSRRWRLEGLAMLEGRWRLGTWKYGTGTYTRSRAAAVGDVEQERAGDVSRVVDRAGARATQRVDRPS